MSDVRSGWNPEPDRCHRIQEEHLPGRAGDELRPSRTAEGVAAIRAAEMVLHPLGRRVFEDPIARHLMGARMNLLLRSGPLLRALFWCHQRLYSGMIYEVLARAKYAEENLRRLACEGIRQVAILGAGFDATAWLPGLPDDLVVYEVDRAATQQLKRERLARAGLAEPARAVFVPLDLGRGDLGAALNAAGHRRDQITLVTLLGVLPYLTQRSVNSVFKDMGEAFAPGSEIIYSYFSKQALDPSRNTLPARLMAWRLARIGEPFLFSADPVGMAAFAAAAGLEQVENLDGAEMTARYFSAMGDSRVVGGWVNLARALVV